MQSPVQAHVTNAIPGLTNLGIFLSVLMGLLSILIMIFIFVYGGYNHYYYYQVERRTDLQNEYLLQQITEGKQFTKDVTQNLDGIMQSLGGIKQEISNQYISHLIHTPTIILNSFYPNLPDGNYVHVLAEIELMTKIENLWIDINKFGLVVFGHKTNGKTTAISRCLLEYGVSYVRYQIPSQSNMVLDWLSNWFPSYQQQNRYVFDFIPILDEQKIRNNNTDFLFNDIYPNTTNGDAIKKMHEKLKKNKFRIHVMLAVVDLTSNQSVEQQLFVQLFETSGATVQNLMNDLDKYSKHFPYGTLFWIQIKRVNDFGTAYQQLTKFCRSLGERSNIRCLLEISKGFLIPSSEEVAGRFDFFRFQPMDMDETQSFYDALYGSIKSHQLTTEEQQVIGGKPLVSIELSKYQSLKEFVEHKTNIAGVLFEDNIKRILGNCSYVRYDRFKYVVATYILDTPGSELQANKTKLATLESQWGKVVVEYNPMSNQYFFTSNVYGFQYCNQ